MKQAHNTVKICSFIGASIVCIMFLSSCASYPHVSTGNPKVYNDGQTRMLLDKLYEDTRSNVPSITDTTPQIISRIRQEYNRLLTIKANTSGTESAESTGSKLKYDPMTTPTDAATSLGFTQILRERIRRQQDISRHEMLYIGDQSFLDEKNLIYLIRMDITLMYAHTSAIRKYLVLDFSIDPADKTDDISDKIRIYALAPDYASTISEDSLVTLGMKTLNGMVSGNIKGVDVSLERNLEKQLEQYFTSTNESPLQFAIPRESSPRPGFAFGFGPQRHITKRRWYNPMSWFGDTYVVEYEYMPVTADCYALIVADKSMIGKDLNITVKTFPLCDMKSGFNWKGESVSHCNYKISLMENTSAKTKDTSTLFPDSIDPSVDSTIIIQTGCPVNSSSVVSVHGIEIASTNISILGRNMLKVKIPANKTLQSLPKDYEVECIVVTPGFSGVETFYLTIINKEASVADRASSAPLTLTPTEGRVGEMATISSSDKTDFPLKGIEAIYVGNNKIPKEQFSYQDDSKIKFNLPEPGADICASVGVFVLPQFPKPYLMNFKYKVPLTGGGNL